MQWHEVVLKQIHQETFNYERKKLHCHKNGSGKHLPPPKVKRRYEESSASDALTPKKRGKMRTCLWACPLTPTPQPHLPSPCLCKINIRRSSKMA